MNPPPNYLLCWVYGAALASGVYAWFTGFAKSPRGVWAARLVHQEDQSKVFWGDKVNWGSASWAQGKLAGEDPS